MNLRALTVATGLIACTLMGAFAAPGSGSGRQEPANRGREAILGQLFAKGIRLLRDHRPYDARLVLEEAAKLDPNDAAIRSNLGLAYQTSGNLAKALDQFATALKLRPGMPQATMNMAGCYQAMGRLDEAIAWYERYMRENPQDPECAQIKDVVASLRKLALRPAGDPGLPDYFQTIEKEGLYRWPAEAMPIGVYIAPGGSVRGFRPSFARILADAFEVWSDASGSRITFSMLESEAGARIICNWTDDPARVTGSGTQGERGMAHLYARGGKVERATVTILVSPAMAEATLSDEEMTKVCLHEVGHALGLQGHSTNNHDVMFFTVDAATVWPVLSRRDKATILRLYQAYRPHQAGASQ